MFTPGTGHPQPVSTGHSALQVKFLYYTMRESYQWKNYIIKNPGMWNLTNLSSFQVRTQILTGG